MTNKVKPCCKCGKNDAVELLDIEKSLFWVSCARCGEETKVHENVEEAIKAWNRMATISDSEAKEAMKNISQYCVEHYPTCKG